MTVAKKYNVRSLVNAALRPVLLSVNVGCFHAIIEKAILLVTDVQLLEEFIGLAKKYSQKLEMLAYERAIELV